MMATLGELEFGFAHSMGDSLAAIIADPDSTLRGTTLAGSTYPWVFAGRRHDRCIRHGWGWAGPIGKDARELPDKERLRRKGYRTEQILSTTLFLLYRSLGGDSASRELRISASDYVVYLIMTGLEALPQPLVIPTPHAELLACALGEADELTEACDTNEAQAFRRGGCAFKVVRWAFEAQGMHADPVNPDPFGPGRPPRVDIYVPDRRPADLRWGSSIVQYGAGSYVPVPLDPPTATEIPLWFAAPDAIRPVADGVHVQVANRGWGVATGVQVRLWVKDWLDGDPLPEWDPATWTSVPLSPTPQIANILPSGQHIFGTFRLAPSSVRRLVLAQSDCRADRSIVNPVLGLSCSAEPTRLDQLVPGDNNLGLAVIPPI